MVNGYIYFNILFLNSTDMQEFSILIKQGFKINKGLLFKPLMFIESVDNFTDAETLIKYYKTEYFKILDSKDSKINKYVTFENQRQVTKTFLNKDDLKVLEKMINISYDISKQAIYQSSSLSNYISSNLEKDGVVPRYSIELKEKDTTNFQIEFDFKEEEHNYYNEVVNQQLLSSFQDGFNTAIALSVIDSLNSKDSEVVILKEILKSLIQSLSINPAVVGAPILLPTDATNLNTSLTNLDNKILSNYNKNYDTIKNIENSIKGINSAKQ